MKILLTVISSKRVYLSGPAGDLVRLYLERAGRYLPCSLRAFSTEAALLEFVANTSARTRPILLLADSRGQQLSSEDFAETISSYLDGGAQQVIFAVGPADGWSAGALDAAARLVAFGKITLPHELAAVVAAEQLYRALTICAGHPYHSGH